eukprot:1440193-Pyramimonas_sp.AAC.1
MRGAAPQEGIAECDDLCSAAGNGIARSLPALRGSSSRIPATTSRSNSRSGGGGSGSSRGSSSSSSSSSR